MKIRQVCDLRNDARELAQRLRHQPRLHAHVAVAHFAIELGFGHQRRHRIDHQHIDRSRSDQRAGDFERLLAVIRLRNQQVVHVHAQLARIGRIERVLDVDERRHAARLLRLRHHLQRDGRLARRLRPEDLDDAAAREAAHAQRRIERNGAGGNHRDRHDGVLGSQPQDRTFAELLLDLPEGQLQSARAFFFVHGELLKKWRKEIIAAFARRRK